MSIPALATLQQFQTRYESGVGVADEGRIEALLDDASALVRDIIAPEDYVDDADELEAVPGAIIAVVCEAARRAFDNPAGLEGETTGNWTWRGSTKTESGVYLTRQEKRTVRRAAGKLGVGTVTLEGFAPIPTVDDQLLDDAGSGDPILYFATEDLP